MIGKLVEYCDASGNLRGAIITAVRDGTTRTVRLSVFQPGATLADVDGVGFDAAGRANTWRFPQ